jgi:DNA repair protein RadC
VAYLREVELRYRISEIDSEAIGEKVTSSETIMQLFGDLQNETKEKLIAISLDSQHKILCFEIVAIGSIKSIYLRPMEVFRSAIVLNAANLKRSQLYRGGEGADGQRTLAIRFLTTSV